MENSIDSQSSSSPEIKIHLKHGETKEKPLIKLRLSQKHDFPTIQEGSNSPPQEEEKFDLNNLDDSPKFANDFKRQFSYSNRMAS